MKPPIEIAGHIIERRKRFEADGAAGDVHFKPTSRQGFTTVSVKLDDGREAYGKYRHPSRVRLFIRKPRRKVIQDTSSPFWYK